MLRSKEPRVIHVRIFGRRCGAVPLRRAAASARGTDVLLGQRARAGTAAAARGASARARPRPRSSARTRCAPRASSPYLARKDPRKSLARPLECAADRRVLADSTLVCVHRCCSRLLLRSSLCASRLVQTHDAGIYWCFHFILFSVRHARVFSRIGNALSRFLQTILSMLRTVGGFPHFYFQSCCRYGTE